MAEQRLDLKLELPAAVQAGAAVSGRLLLTNLGEQPLSLVTPLYNAALNLLVFDHLWNPVAPTTASKAHVAHTILDLAPGETVAVELADLGFVSGTAAQHYQLAAGTYFVMALYHPGTDRLPAQSAYPIVVFSNVVTLHVR